MGDEEARRRKADEGGRKVARQEIELAILRVPLIHTTCPKPLSKSEKQNHRNTDHADPKR